MSSPPSWAFIDPPNVAVLTTAEVTSRRMPILYVTHDEDDGTWQFHTGDPVDVRQGRIVALREIVELDPSVVVLADLPLGWCASRATPASGWARRPRA